jgi:7-cyano-7-deazaguanine synthase
LSLAVNVAIQANADMVTIGCNADDEATFPDCRREFISAMNAAVRAAGYQIEICAPYLDWQKWKIGGLAREMGINASDVWTCYRGGPKPCGECPACSKLQLAFA